MVLTDNQNKGVGKGDVETPENACSVVLCSRLDILEMKQHRKEIPKTPRDNRRNFDVNVISGLWNTKEDQGRLLTSGPKVMHHPLYFSKLWHFGVKDESERPKQTFVYGLRFPFSVF
jgi:hypothetical protein